MRERKEQDRLWVEQKEESERINRLLLGGQGGCFKDGRFFRQTLQLRVILKRLVGREDARS